MDKVKTMEIKCDNKDCGEWFRSPIFFGDLESFDLSIMSGNIVECPHCNTMTGCNKENMRVRATSGGFRGNET